MMLAAMLAVALLAASPAPAQEKPAHLVVAKAPCEPEPPKAAPPPPPKAAPPPPPPKAAPAPAPAPAKQLPASGGIGAPALFALGAGALLVGGGLLARRIIR